MTAPVAAQPGILAPVPRAARHLFFDVAAGHDPRRGIAALADSVDGETVVVGLGPSLVKALGAPMKGLRTHPTYAGPGFEVPATPAALWCWLRGDDRGDLVHATRRVERSLGAAFTAVTRIDAFQHHDSRDLSGYEDGTENPKGDDALAAALVSGQGAGRDGASFVAVQQWVHDFGRYDAMSPAERDDAVGRRRSDNEEIEDAPASAHVKRTAQESFDPEAFVLRRSMPWADAQRAGLVFVAFWRSLDAFEAQLRRMVGEEDGIVDALFGFTRPVSGATFWCPPMRAGRLDLRAVGLA